MTNRLNRAQTVKAARKAKKAAKRSAASTVRRRAKGGAKSRSTPAPPRPKPRSAATPAQNDAVRPGARRIRGVMAFLGAVGVVLLTQAARLQLVHYERFADWADRQSTSTSVVAAKRGAIRDRNGDELAITVDVDSVYFEWKPNQPRPTERQASRLAALLGRPTDVIRRKLMSDRRFVYLARRVDAATATQVRSFGVPGVGTKPEPKRFYANVHLAGHVLGFTNVEGEGRAGVERRFDGQLKGRRGSVSGYRDAFGTPILSNGSVSEVSLRGSDVELTLDRHIQYASEQALQEAVTTHRAKAGVALVMVPDSGEVLALASYPRFNPNNLRETTVSERTNRAVNAVFEPGSTMKMVTVAAALEESLIKRGTVLDCEEGSWKVGNTEIHDAQHRYGALDITQIIQKSSNICAAKIGFRLGRRRLHTWLRRFGFGQRSGVELPGELRGLIRPPAKWSDIGLANISFGQGISATPLQILQAAAVLANKGIRVPPRLVRAIVSPDGQRIEAPRAPAERVLSEPTARAVSHMMTSVAEAGGTAVEAAIPGFRVAGKTGTAQKIDPVTRAYSHELHVSSFVGFAPADHPELVALVLLDEPQGSVYGGEVAAPAWRKLMVAAVAARGLRPDDPAAWRAFLARHRAMPALPPTAARAEVVHGEAARWSEEGDATAAEVSHLPGSLDLALSEKAQRVLGQLASNAEKERHSSTPRMPNFARLTLREVLNRAADTRCDLVVDGSGRVVAQEPSAGMPLAPDARCELTLAPRR